MQTINIKIHTEGCEPLINDNGDWIDLRCAEDITLRAPHFNVHTNELIFQTGLLSLGISMEIPEGYEAHVLPRSSTFAKYGIVMSNSMGIIDQSYSGDNDIWKFPYIAYKDCVISKGTRIAQFRLVKTQKAELGGINFNKVDQLQSPDRGGFGSTGTL